MLQTSTLVSVALSFLGISNVILFLPSYLLAISQLHRVWIEDFVCWVQIESRAKRVTAFSSCSPLEKYKLALQSLSIAFDFRIYCVVNDS